MCAMKNIISVNVGLCSCVLACAAFGGDVVIKAGSAVPPTVALQKAFDECFLAGGGTVGGYMEFLERRQREEQAYRDKARSHVERAPKSHLYQTWSGVNAALRERGLAPIEMPDSLRTGSGVRP